MARVSRRKDLTSGELAALTYRASALDQHTRFRLGVACDRRGANWPQRFFNIAEMHVICLS
jgi:hypothetical protein